MSVLFQIRFGFGSYYQPPPLYHVGGVFVCYALDTDSSVIAEL